MILFVTVDRQELYNALSSADPFWVLLSVIMFFPQTLAIGYRWVLIAKPLARISLKEAVRQVLASSCLNLVLPSKLGDLAKGVFLYRQKKCGWEEGFQIVFFEKFLDLAALSIFMIMAALFIWPSRPEQLLMILLGFVLLGFVIVVYFTPYGAAFFRLFVPKKKQTGFFAKIAAITESAPKVMTLIQSTGSRKYSLIGWSLTIWALHLIQIVFFFFAIGVPVSALEVILKMPMAMFVGSLPITMAGFGTREWAIVYLFESETVTAASLLAVGVLFSSRYIFPALVGLLFVQRYYGLSQQAQKRNQLNRKRKQS